MPNRRRRRLSTATSAVAALVVASPFAYVTVSGLLTDTKPHVEHHEFVKAAGMTDLPGELMNALSQGLSQFGVNLPPVPSLTGANLGDDVSARCSPLLGPGAHSEPRRRRHVGHSIHRPASGNLGTSGPPVVDQEAV